MYLEQNNIKITLLFYGRNLILDWHDPKNLLGNS
jgi:hypothetical protein